MKRSGQRTEGGIARIQSWYMGYGLEQALDDLTYNHFAAGSFQAEEAAVINGKR